jgi:hypothetical protein
MIKSRKITWVGLTAHFPKVGNLKRKDHVGYLSVDGRMNLGEIGFIRRGIMNWRNIGSNNAII